MDKKVKLLLGLLAFAVMMGAAVMAYQFLTEQGYGPENLAREDARDENREAAPDFAMLDADGNELRLSDFFGAPIVLNFWATWCPACVIETPHFETLYLEMGNEIHVIKVNLLDGQRETRAAVDRFMEEQGYTFSLYFDKAGEAASAYGIRGIPQTIFIDAEGYIVARLMGAASEQELRAGIAAARGN